MKYLALLRGINVGGKNMIKMSALKETFQHAGFTNVTTYINSGNILFESDKSNTEHLTEEIDALLQKTFFSINTVVLSYKNLADIITHVPNTWTQKSLRKYVGFIKGPAKPDEIIKEVQLKDNIDFIEKGPHVVYMSTKMTGLTKSGFPKLITKPVYKYVTIRNYNTVQKLLMYMEQK